MQTKKKILFIMMISIVITILKISSMDGIYRLDQCVLANFQYMNKNSLMNIYENSIFILPYLIINMISFLEIRCFFDNKIFLVSRFGSIYKYHFYIIKKIVEIVLKNTSTYFVITIITSIFYIGNVSGDLMKIGLCFINITFIILFFCYLFYFFLGIFSSQYCYLLGVIVTLLSSISGFLAKYLGNDYWYNIDFMTRNVSLDISGLMNLTFDYKYIMIMIFIVLIAIFITYKVKEDV